MKKENVATELGQHSPETEFCLQDVRVLVVEDDRSHRTMIDKVLQTCELQTMQAEKGIIALSKLDAGEVFDLIIMDLDMPELDGIEAVKTIRMREVKYNKPRVPVLAFTANRQAEDKEACIAAGMDAYLPKDVFLPRWRQTLIDNLQGLFTGKFNPDDFQDQEKAQTISDQYNIEEFDIELFEQSAALLKEELAIAIEEYLEDAAAYIREIEAGALEQNVEKVARGSHPLKSNSKGFGLIAVAKISEAINFSCETSQDESIALQTAQGLVLQLKEAFAFGEKTLKKELQMRS